MTSVPTALITGSIGYLILGAVVYAMIFSSRATGMLSKDNASIGFVVASIGVVATWLFWLCAWMHQWHPLIKPIYEG